jgi:hypothetical protein
MDSGGGGTNGGGGGDALAERSVVKLVQDADGSWQLFRNGALYFVKGAGGGGRKDLLAEIGGNSIRTWGVGDDTAAMLDEAYRLGLSVTLGYWMRHERHGFNYDDAVKVARQHAKLLEAVRTFKDHPALLCWAIGNEAELAGGGKNPNLWKAIGAAATAIKQIDPHHPTMTVIADLAHGKNIENIKQYCSDIDIVGINAYGGVYNVARRFASCDPCRPYLLTEYAPANELGKTSWGRVKEMNSSEKAAQFAKQYKAAVADQPGLCLGSYLFTWGRKSEVTETMFGTFTQDGSRTEAIETFRSIYGGQPAANVPPQVTATKLSKNKLAPEAKATASIELTTTDGGALSYTWVLRYELGSTMGGDRSRESKIVEGAVVGDGPCATLTAPSEPGHYRLYVQVNDGQGCAAYANWPILVEQQQPAAVAVAAAPVGGNTVCVRQVLTESSKAAAAVAACSLSGDGGDGGAAATAAAAHAAPLSLSSASLGLCPCLPVCVTYDSVHLCARRRRPGI